MNTNTYLNNTYNSNERALAELLGQLVRSNNPSSTGFNSSVGRGGGSGIGEDGFSSGSGRINNYGGLSVGLNRGGDGWGGNIPNDWNRGCGNVDGGGNNMMPSGNSMMPQMMHRGGGMNMNNVSGGGGGGFSGIPPGVGNNDVFGGMQQVGNMNDSFRGMQQGGVMGGYLGMSRGGHGGFGDMQPSRVMPDCGFGVVGGFPQNNVVDNFSGDGFGGGMPAQGGSRGQWVSGAANRSNRIAALPQMRSNSRPSIPTQGRRSSVATKAPLSSKSVCSSGASAPNNASKPVQVQKRKSVANPAAPPKAKISTNSVKTGDTENKTPTTVKAANSTEPRKVLTSTGGRWYQHFLVQGLKPDEARKKAFENNDRPFAAGPQGAAKKSAKKTKAPPKDTYVRHAIFAKGFPEHMLDPEDLSSLEEAIIDEVANNSGTESKLQFERLIKKPGMVIIDCINQQTADWLKDIIPKLTNWDSPELAVCSEEDIPEAYVMTITLPKSAGQEYDQTLALIQSQNADLITDSWEWVHEREEGDNLVLTIRVDKDSHSAIKEKRWKLFYKFGLIDVNFARYLRYALSKRLVTESEAAGRGENKGNELNSEVAAAIVDDLPSPPPAPIISK